MTDHLRRNLAPISTDAWKLIDDQAAQTLRHYLAGRALVDFDGPKGWAHAVEVPGRITALQPDPGEGTTAALRVTQPLVETRTSFSLSVAELDVVERGGDNPDLDAVVEAAKKAALVEDRAIFHGYEPAGIEGIAGASSHQPLDISTDYQKYPDVVARAVAELRRVGVGGPYAIALGPRCYTGVVETTEHGGYPVLEHIRLILGGPVLWAPAVDGAAVLSVRGDDYELACGQDFAIGYSGHDGDQVNLYLEESFTLVVKEPSAGIYLRYPD